MISPNMLHGEPMINIDIVGDLSMETLSSVRVVLSENVHDLAVLNLSTSSPQRLGFYDGYPIYMEYGRQVMAAPFVGYIREIRPTFIAGRQVASMIRVNDVKPLSGVSLMCFGASTRMRVEHSRTWTQVTVPAVVAELAKQYRFSAAIEPHNHVWPVIAQPGVGDFEFLRSLADMIGYRFTITGTHLRFYDPLNVVRRASPDLSISPSTSNIEATLTLRQFTPTLGQNTATGFGGTINLDGYDPSTGEPFSVSTVERGPILGESSPMATAATRSATSSAGSLSQALSDLQAQRRKDAWPITADVVSSGSVLALPGNMIEINGVEAEYAGMWYIIEVEHRMSSGSWVSAMKVGKDGVGAKQVQRPNVQYPLPPKPLLLLNDWVSSRGV